MNPPKSVCLLRLSALGDCTNIVPIVRTIQTHWPNTQISWVINSFEAKFVGNLPGVEFIPVDKKAGRAGRKALKKELKSRHFDVLFHMHASMRANLIARLIPAQLKLGFNRRRRRDLQQFFVNKTITEPTGNHVLDGFFAFLEYFGLYERELDWSLPIYKKAVVQAAMRLPAGKPWLVISPASSHSDRNWSAQNYAAVADWANSSGLQVALIGAPSPQEKALGEAIVELAQTHIVNLVGDSPLPMMVPLLQRAAVLLSPDSGPAHIANATDTPVVALHAATDSTRSGPYKSLKWAVDCYDKAAEQFLNKPAKALPWGTKIEKPGVMDIISPDLVIQKLQAALEAGHT